MSGMRLRNDPTTNPTEVPAGTNAPTDKDWLRASDVYTGIANAGIRAIMSGKSEQRPRDMAMNAAYGAVVSVISRKIEDSSYGSGSASWNPVADSIATQRLTQGVASALYAGVVEKRPLQAAGGEFVLGVASSTVGDGVAKWLHKDGDYKIL